MATIEDDDERLLARIGYRQVQATAVLDTNADDTDSRVGAEARVHKVVNGLLCHLDSWSSRFGTCHIRDSCQFWWPSNCSMGMVYWISHGNVYSKFRLVY